MDQTPPPPPYYKRPVPTTFGEILASIKETPSPPSPSPSPYYNRSIPTTFDGIRTSEPHRSRTPPPPPPYTNKPIPPLAENIATSEPTPKYNPPPTPPSPSSLDVEAGTYTLDTTCDNCGLLIASIPKCLGEWFCLSWTFDGCCGTEGPCDPEDGCAMCCTACDCSTTVGLVLRGFSTCYPRGWRWLRRWAVAAAVLVVLVWVVGRARLW